MSLSNDEIKLFYKLHPLLLLETNRIHRRVSGVEDMDDLMKLGLEQKHRIRDALYPDFPNILSSLLGSKAHGLSAGDIETVREWRHFVQRRFIIYKHLKNYSIFLDLDDEPRAYAVHAISNPIAEIVPGLPLMVDAILLPFKGRIIHDGFIVSTNITFGGGIRASFRESYQTALQGSGMIESLPYNPATQLHKAVEYLKAQSTKQTRESMRRHAELLSCSGVTKGYFAFSETTILAGGVSKEQVLSIVNQLVPAANRVGIEVFRIRDGKCSLESDGGRKGNALDEKF